MVYDRLMAVELFPYQIEGAQWLAANKFALLADEMGLGKSAQAIRAADLAYATEILVCGPAISRRNWQREFQQWQQIDRITTTIEARGDTYNRFKNVVITSYELLNPKAKVFDRDWDVVILDEAHFLKEPTTKRTKSVFGRDGVAHRAKRVWALTGTPAPNHAGELWILFKAFGITELSRDDFIQRYCETKKVYYGYRKFKHQVIGTNPFMLSELKAKLNSFMLMRKKFDVLKDLPPISYHHITVPRSEFAIDESKSLANWVFPINRESEFYEKIEEQRRVVQSVLNNEPTPDKKFSNQSVFPVLEAVAKSVSTLRMYTGLQKVKGVVEMVKSELDSGAYEKIVIFAVHRDVVVGIRDALRDYGAVCVFGGSTMERRDRAVRKFQMTKKCQVIVGNIQAAGTNLTLTAAHQVLFAEVSWVPGENAQAAMRCHRIGQKMPVTVRMVSLEDSFDQKITGMLQRKARELSKIFNMDREKFLFDREPSEPVSPEKQNLDEDIFS